MRSSATAEDLPEASFAGQQETFLNIFGGDALLEACRRCFASLFTDRAISYRENHGFDHLQVALSVGIQKMVRLDQGGAGVMFSIDTETGFKDAALINAAWGLGESVVQGSVDPDEYIVFKPLLAKQEYRPIINKNLGKKAKKIVYADACADPVQTVETTPEEQASLVLSDDEILTLAGWAVAIEQHYQQPMDMEWAKDGETGDLFIVQARPETVQSQKESGILKTYTLKNKGKELLSGDGIGDAIAAGKVCKLASASEIEKFEDNGVLVTAMTDPDWVPIMKRAAAIVTDHGGRTSHAAIVSRELGLPAIVGTGKGTEILNAGQEVTVSCAEGDRGFVYEGIAEYEAKDVSLENIPTTQTQIMLNLANPAAALRWWRLPSAGVGLARMEFIINNLIKIHSMALVHWETLEDQDVRQAIAELTNKVLEVLVANGLSRGEKGLEIYVMCEIPSNVVLASQFAERFDGFSIGSNDLTQLVFGIERDSERLAELFDERNEAVTEMIATVIRAAHQAGRKIGICGQAPSDHPEFARFLVHAGIDSISVNPDSFITVKQHVADAEAEAG